MILTDFIDLIINKGNINYYKKFNNNLKIGDNLKININNLPKNSRYEIDVKCENCGIIKRLQYCNYNKYMINKNKYTCKKCTLKNNNLLKYNVENVFQLESIKEKIKNTVKEKYNVDNISQLEDIKQKKIKTNLNKYNTKYPLSNSIIKEKIKKTVKEKYNVDNISQLENVKLKKIKTSLKNYGVIHPSKSDIFKDNIKSTNLKKYGVEWNFLDLNIKNKIKKTNLIKFGYENPSQSDVIKNKIKNSNILYSHKKIYENNNKIVDIIDNDYIMKCDCNKDHTFKINRVLFYKRRETNTIICTICNPIDKKQSGLELQLINFIKENCDHNIILNKRNIINPYELDIYIPDLNLAFEFNGVYLHNELNKSNNYHYNKSKMCKDLNINLIHIYEDDWIYKQNITKSMILNKLNKISNKFFARRCKIKQINDISIVKTFMNKNHIQGYTTSTIKLGLYYDKELISMMLFKNNNNDYELVRFCSKLNTVVIGGASKLLNYFINNYRFNELKTFSDIGYSTGDLYEKIGFKFDKYIKPSYYYVVDGVRIHKSNFKKQILTKKGFDKNKSEHQIMLERNIYRIYNSGYKKYILNK